MKTNLYTPSFRGSKFSTQSLGNREGDGVGSITKTDDVITGVGENAEVNSVDNDVITVEEEITGGSVDTVLDVVEICELVEWTVVGIIGPGVLEEII